MWSRPITTAALGVLGLSWAFAAMAGEAAPDRVWIHPASSQLQGGRARRQIIVMADVEGRVREVTEEAEIDWSPRSRLERLSPSVFLPAEDGRVTVGARWRGASAEATVDVVDARVALPVSFELDVQPILTAKGCNAGACHGKARGQNGFKMSLLGFDADFDHAALTRHARGRRVFPAVPRRSLILMKATAAAPHGGGMRIDPSSVDYQTLLQWIEAGCVRRLESEPRLQGVEVYPQTRFLQADERQQLVVTARYSDGSVRDVTSLCTFQSNESAVVAVTPQGRIKAGALPGEAAIMARYMGFFGICRVAIPQEDRPPPSYYDELPRANFIDEHVWRKLADLGFTVSPPANDATLHRRLHLDLVGRIPTPRETRQFLSSQDPTKRRALVDRLLDRPEYADHWANKWADLLRPNPYRVGIKAVLNYDDWIRQAFRENRPYDQFARQLITARGSTWRNGAATLFRDRRSPEEIATLMSQLLLGIRLECAKCHHHPFEVWSQDDFYRFAGYFARVGYKGTGLSPPISGGEEVILIRPTGAVKHPLTGESLTAAPLFGEAPAADDFEDPRQALAQWVTSQENDYFAKALVNRVWAELMGKGLVEPVDDLRATNPPTNGPLLDALAADFRRLNYDVKALIRRIVASHVYSLSAEPTSGNKADRYNFSRHYRQRLRAEVILDAINDITAAPSSFAALPAASRANQIWTHRVPSLFLDTFGRPDPNQDPPCERVADSTVTQSLHMMNAVAIHRKITASSGRAAELAAKDWRDDQLLEELYLLVYSRLPEEDERRVGRELLSDKQRSRQEITEDLLWAMLNTPEFLFKN